jgi:hypothetical protein
MTTLFDCETALRLLDEIESKGLSLYALMAARSTSPLPLARIRQEIRGYVGHERERAEFARFAQTRDGCLCGRCGGYGGSDSWPGFTCFDCGGRGYVPAG